MRCSTSIRSLLVLAALSLSIPALADDYVFGFTPSGSQTLTLQIQGGGSVALNASNKGYYTDAGASETLFDNYQTYLAGSLSGREYNNFFTFDLSNVSGVITGATLSLYNPSQLTDGGDGFYSDFTNGALYTTYDVTTRLSRLNAVQSSATDIYNDLGSGTAYGSYTFTAADDGQQIAIVLNADALSALNLAKGATFAIGGAEVPENVTITTPTSATPEPASFFLLGPALAGLGMMRSRMRRA